MDHVVLAVPLPAHTNKWALDGGPPGHLSDFLRSLLEKYFLCYVMRENYAFVCTKEL